MVNCIGIYDNDGAGDGRLRPIARHLITGSSFTFHKFHHKYIDAFAPIERTAVAVAHIFFITLPRTKRIQVKHVCLSCNSIGNSIHIPSFSSSSSSFLLSASSVFCFCISFSHSGIQYALVCGGTISDGTRCIQRGSCRLFTVAAVLATFWVRESERVSDSMVSINRLNARSLGFEITCMRTWGCTITWIHSQQPHFGRYHCRFKKKTAEKPYLISPIAVFSHHWIDVDDCRWSTS